MNLSVSKGLNKSETQEIPMVMTKGSSPLDFGKKKRAAVFFLSAALKRLPDWHATYTHIYINIYKHIHIYTYRYLYINT